MICLKLCVAVLLVAMATAAEKKVAEALLTCIAKDQTCIPGNHYHPCCVDKAQHCGAVYNNLAQPTGQFTCQQDTTCIPENTACDPNSLIINQHCCTFLGHNCVANPASTGLFDRHVCKAQCTGLGTACVPGSVLPSQRCCKAFGHQCQANPIMPWTFICQDAPKCLPLASPCLAAAPTPEFECCKAQGLECQNDLSVQGGQPGTCGYKKADQLCLGANHQCQLGNQGKQCCQNQGLSCQQHSNAVLYPGYFHCAQGGSGKCVSLNGPCDLNGSKNCCTNKGLQCTGGKCLYSGGSQCLPTTSPCTIFGGKKCCYGVCGRNSRGKLACPKATIGY